LDVSDRWSASRRFGRHALSTVDSTWLCRCSCCSDMVCRSTSLYSSFDSFGSLNLKFNWRLDVLRSNHLFCIPYFITGSSPLVFPFGFGLAHLLRKPNVPDNGHQTSHNNQNWEKPQSVVADACTSTQND